MSDQIVVGPIECNRPVTTMLESFIRPEHRHWDTGTHHEVVIQDCYRIANRLFTVYDVVIDVGANIGLFSGLALKCGAGVVISVEASPSNFLALDRNLAEYAGRSIRYNNAVWRSDEPRRTIRLHDDPPDGNTGGLSMLHDSGEVEVTTVALDELIGNREIAYLKVDCEGSEYPILYTSKKLAQVREIAIELHPVDHLLKDWANVRPGDNTPEGMTRFLTEQGFKVNCEARSGMDPGWAYVWAVRLPLKENPPNV